MSKGLENLSPLERSLAIDGMLAKKKSDGERIAALKIMYQKLKQLVLYEPK
jgi:hypothetical protein